ncbi:MAG: hypothetical protein GON13_00895 [Nanoarchaeota archaeon]|nr:hypothetical protein [Nanoarchaeota archaeon]
MKKLFLILLLLLVSGCVSSTQELISNDSDVINASGVLVIEKDFVQELGVINAELIIAVSDV